MNRSWSEAKKHQKRRQRLALGSGRQASTKTGGAGLASPGSLGAHRVSIISVEGRGEGTGVRGMKMAEVLTHGNRSPAARIGAAITEALDPVRAPKAAKVFTAEEKAALQASMQAKPVLGLKPTVKPRKRWGKPWRKP